MNDNGADLLKLMKVYGAQGWRIKAGHFVWEAERRPTATSLEFLYARDLATLARKLADAG